MQESDYTYNAIDDGLAAFNSCFTSRNGDGSGDPEENCHLYLRLVAHCRSGGDFLEIGAGLGRIVDIIRPYAKHVVALEPDEARFQSCRNSYIDATDVEVHKTVSAEFRRQHPGRKFDLVTLSMVQQHISTRQSQAILDDVRDLLAPGGVAVITTTHFFEERFMYEKRSVPISLDEFDRYAEDIANQEWGIPVRMFSKQSFIHAIRRASLDVIIWNEFFYARPDREAAIADIYGVSTGEIRNRGLSQVAVVMAQGAPPFLGGSRNAVAAASPGLGRKVYRRIRNIFDSGRK